MFRSNVETLGEVWKQQWLAEGRAEGLAEGLAEGEANGVVTGTALALVCLLEAKFGALTLPQLEQIRTADLATLGDSLKRAFTAPVLPRKLPGSIEAADDLLEVTNEIVRLGEIWKRHCHAVGRAEGLAEIRATGWSEAFARGLARSWADSLLHLLAERFGAVPPKMRDRISKAKPATLKRWFKRATTESNLSAVFRSEAKHAPGQTRRGPA